ncbi:MAG: thioredoxin domain-containing protein [bacterium]
MPNFQRSHPQPVNAPRKQGLLDAPPKTTFVMGLFIGIALTAVSFLVFGVSDGNTDLDPSAVKGAAAEANDVVPTQPTGPTEDASKITSPTSSDHYRGAKPEDAKVVFVEYSDFECTFCSRIHPTLKRIAEENSDAVSWVYRHFPLSSIHPQATSAANASECAAEQGKFWEFADELIANQNSLGSDLYSKLASDFGLNTSKFANCMADDKYGSEVTKDQSEGEIAGVNGTPATFVLEGNDTSTGQLVSGALPYETFKSLLDQIL